MSDHFDGRRFFNPDGGVAGSFSKVPKMLREPRTPWPRWIDEPPSQPPALDGPSILRGRGAPAAKGERT